MSKPSIFDKKTLRGMIRKDRKVYLEHKGGSVWANSDIPKEIHRLFFLDSVGFLEFFETYNELLYLLHDLGGKKCAKYIASILQDTC